MHQATERIDPILARKTVYYRHVSAGGYFEDGATAKDATLVCSASSGCSIEIAVASLHKLRIWYLAVGGIKLVQNREPTRGGNLKNGAAAVRIAEARVAVLSFLTIRLSNHVHPES